MNRSKVAGWANHATAPLTAQKEQPEFWEQYAEIVGSLTGWVARTDVRQAANLLLHLDRWLHQNRSRLDVRPGNIVEVELGTNFEHEYSFCHPCILLRRQGPVLTVIPLTSQDSGRGVYIDDTTNPPTVLPPTDGSFKYRWRVEFILPSYAYRSVALIEQTRVASINRVVKVWKNQMTGDVLCVPVPVMHEIERVLCKALVPSVAAQADGKNQLLHRLKETQARLAKTETALREREARLEALVDYMVNTLGMSGGDVEKIRHEY